MRPQPLQAACLAAGDRDASLPEAGRGTDEDTVGRQHVLVGKSVIRGQGIGLVNQIGDKFVEHRRLQATKKPRQNDGRGFIKEQDRFIVLE
jgi:hypothetical protein